jgi:hypothetical protein
MAYANSFSKFRIGLLLEVTAIVNSANSLSELTGSKLLVINAGYHDCKVAWQGHKPGMLYHSTAKVYPLPLLKV